ncbi:hypothetical protein DLAC_08766 [Tieghemostelium lacteum]|uniref:Uncharacterized protein n=1 Tax=Tieghemostelium lacteum TaxID=361077 RepID=A0A151Z876_TIELA|nr:hypothetical protein DLAC_08766 [Tieghemostelium lacteum]|eukprot:KYQ90173.1 hypothetical protein DLAC_08766 [Tieghemostelium lacteum]
MDFWLDEVEQAKVSSKYVSVAKVFDKVVNNNQPLSSEQDKLIETLKKPNVSVTKDLIKSMEYLLDELEEKNFKISKSNSELDDGCQLIQKQDKFVVDALDTQNKAYLAKKAKEVDVIENQFNDLTQQVANLKIQAKESAQKERNYMDTSPQQKYKSIMRSIESKRNSIAYSKSHMAECYKCYSRFNT